MWIVINERHVRSLILGVYKQRVINRNKLTRFVVLTAEVMKMQVL